jgi:hypothetical protein
MPDAPLFTLEEAHRLFAKRLNGEVWELLDKPSSSCEMLPEKSQGSVVFPERVRPALPPVL